MKHEEFKTLAGSLIYNQYAGGNLHELVNNFAQLLDNNFGEIERNIFLRVLNIETCNQSALYNYWGRMFKIPTTYKDGRGRVRRVSLSFYRYLCQLRMFLLLWPGESQSLNLFLSHVYRLRGGAYVVESNNAKDFLIHFNFPLTSEEKTFFKQSDYLPRVCGYKTLITSLEDNSYFGFASYSTTSPHPYIAGFGLYRGKTEYNSSFATYETEIDEEG